MSNSLIFPVAASIFIERDEMVTLVSSESEGKPKHLNNEPPGIKLMKGPYSIQKIITIIFSKIIFMIFRDIKLIQFPR